MTQALKLLHGTITNVMPSEGESEERFIEGYFTDGLVDTYGHMIDEEPMRKAIEEYKRWGNIRDMHGNPVATAVEIGTKAWNYVKAKIVDDGAWQRAKGNIYKGFSVGILVLNGEFVSVRSVPAEKFAGLSQSVVDAIIKSGEIFKITDLELVEISLVDRPANPRATVLSVKNLDGSSYLPSVIDGVDVLKSMYVEKALNGDNEMKDKVTEVVGGEVDVVESTDAEKDKEVVQHEAEFADVEQESEAEDIVPDVAVKSIKEPIVEQKSADPVIIALSEKIDALSSLVEKMAVVIEGLSNPTTEEVISDAVAEPSVVENSIEPSEAFIERLAEEVSKKIIAERKSVVNTENVEEQDEPSNYKTLKLTQLRRGIAEHVAASLTRR